jgi:S1-C subfamily serine protease
MPVKLQLNELVSMRDAILGTFPSHDQVANLVDGLCGDLDYSDPCLALPSGIFKNAVWQLVTTWNARGLIANLIGGLARAAPFSPDLSNILVHKLRSLPAVETAALQGLVSDRLPHLNAVEWLNTISSRMCAVCRVDFNAFSSPGVGTGFLVSPDLILTAHHVVENLNPGQLLVETAACRFEYLNDSNRTGKVVPFMLPQWRVAFSLPGGIEKSAGGAEPGPDELDFALVRLDREVGVEPFRFASDAAKTDDPCIVLQHPRRAPLQVAFGQVTAFNATGTRMRHNAGTEAGSSGAPCLNQKLEVIALHNATRYPPHGALADYNTAVPILRIKALLDSKNIAIGGMPA